MIKRITKVGNSQGLIFDAALMDLARLKVGDEVNVSVHEGGSVVLTPVRPVPDRAEVSDVIRSTMTRYARTMKRLA